MIVVLYQALGMNTGGDDEMAALPCSAKTINIQTGDFLG